MSTGFEILERRARDERAPVRSLPSLPSPEEARLPNIEAAVGLIQREIARLRLLQRREDQRRAAQAEGDAIVERARRRFEERQRDRERMISVDKRWFWSVAEGLLERLHGEQAERLAKDLNALVDREKRLKGG
jgi:hypothetical protein